MDGYYYSFFVLLGIGKNIFSDLISTYRVGAELIPFEVQFHTNLQPETFSKIYQASQSLLAQPHHTKTMGLTNTRY